jgi:hypothetical protein
MLRPLSTTTALSTSLRVSLDMESPWSWRGLGPDPGGLSARPFLFDPSLRLVADRRLTAPTRRRLVPAAAKGQ